MHGDVDGDGVITAQDAIYVLDQSAAVVNTPDILPMDDLRLIAADVDGDGVITAQDSLYVLDRSANVITQFPIEE